MIHVHMQNMTKTLTYHSEKIIVSPFMQRRYCRASRAYEGQSATIVVLHCSMSSQRTMGTPTSYKQGPTQCGCHKLTSASPQFSSLARLHSPITRGNLRLTHVAWPRTAERLKTCDVASSSSSSSSSSSPSQMHESFASAYFVLFL